MWELLRSLTRVEWIILGAAISVLVGLHGLGKQLEAIFNVLYDIRDRLNLSLPRHPLEDVDDPDAQKIVSELREG